jgi:hypothetical protein
VNLKSFLSAVAVAVIAVLPAKAAGQSPFDNYTATIVPAWERYVYSSPENSGVESIYLFSAPAVGRATVAGPVWFQAIGGYASGALVSDSGEEVTLAGPLDTELSLGMNLRSGSYNATLTGTFVAPTGREQQTLKEARVAALVANEFLPFRTRSWGGGGAAGGSLSVARLVGRGSLGISAGFLSSQKYEPFLDATAPGANFTYRPGNRLELRVAADQNLTRSSKLTLGFVFERTDADIVDGEDLFRPGNRYQGMVSYAFSVGSGSTAILYTGGMHSDGGIVLNPALVNDFSTRTLGLTGGGMRVPVGKVVLVPTIDGRFFRRGSGLGQGYLGGAGLGLEIPFGSHSVTPGGRFRFGNLVVEEGVESRLAGFDFSVDFHFGR